MTYHNDNDFAADPTRVPRRMIIGVLVCIAIYTVLFGLPLFLLWMNS